MRDAIKLLTAAILCVATVGSAWATDIVSVDFEGEKSFEAHVIGAKIGQPGYESAKCAMVSGKGRFLPIKFKIDKPYEDGMKIAFDYKVEVPTGKTQYVALALFTPDQKSARLWQGFKTPSQWTHIEMPLSKVTLHSSAKEIGHLKPGDAIARINIYSRAKDDIETAHTLYVDNLRLFK